MRLAVLGARGLLGRHVAEEMRQHQVVALDRGQCDITRLAEIESAVEGCELIVNCAGFTNVDGCETDPDGAYRANAIGSENVARAARRLGAKAVHISTDFVFDGAHDQLDEFDEPRPLSVYGRSKLAGERLAAAVGGKQFIVRVQGLYGAGGANFSSRLRALLREGKPLTLDAERRVQPTWARSVARQLAVLVETEHYGLYHASSRGETTWAGFARRLAERLAIAPNWREVSTAELKVPAVRPRASILANRMLALRGLDRMPSWEAALDEYSAEEAAR